VVGRGWASVAAVLNALVITFMRFNETRAAGHLNFFSMDAVLAWNFCMRFVFFEIFVLLLDRIRVELATRGSAANNSSPGESPKI
jgi:hypothetical protein